MQFCPMATSTPGEDQIGQFVQEIGLRQLRRETAQHGGDPARPWADVSILDAEEVASLGGRVHPSVRLPIGPRLHRRRKLQLGIIQALRMCIVSVDRNKLSGFNTKSILNSIPLI